MAKIYLDKDADTSVLNGKTISVIGFGSQGKAQAECLRDSGFNVLVGAREGGKSWNAAKAEGFNVTSISDAVKKGDVILFLIPDMEQPKVYEEQVAPNLSPGKALGFAHGFNIHFNVIKPPNYVDVFMVAPKAPGPKLRENFLKGFGVPALLAIHQDYTGNAKKIALAIAKGIGSTRVGVIETTFREETETDLIGEQVVLVGGLMELIKKGFEVLVERGYQPEVAYFEVCNEAKLIMDLIYEGGMEKMLKSVSDTAKYGGLVYGPKALDDKVKENMHRVADNVVSGSFAKEWLEESAKGAPRLKELMSKMLDHPLEKTGKTLREMMGLK